MAGILDEFLDGIASLFGGGTSPAGRGVTMFDDPGAASAGAIAAEKAAAKKMKDGADAQAADQAFAGALGLVSASVGATFPASIPFLAAAGTATTLAWSRLTVPQKAKIWRGE